MKERNADRFYNLLIKKKRYSPLVAHLELTYRCNLDCVHCYCKGLEDKDKELTTSQFKKIIDEIHKEGCIVICFTGGEPLIRDDFLEIYSYAKDKGFIISIFTNGQLFTKGTIDYLVKSPPFSIEITLNGITKETYEAITQVEGSFSKITDIIMKLAKTDLLVVLKSNCLKQNKNEIGQIKAFTEEIFGKPNKKRYRFKYDPMIYPRLNGDKTPCQYRLSFEELIEVKKQDVDLWNEYEGGLHNYSPDLSRDGTFLYRCNSWFNQFFINPYGRKKFCQFSDKFNIDLRTTSFRESFYNVLPKILKEKFKTNSKCINCSLRKICYYCPARAYLETGDEEAPVGYYCDLAKATEKEIWSVNKRDNSLLDTSIRI